MNQQGVEKQASSRQPRRAAFWKAQHIGRYVSIYKSRTTPDHGLEAQFFNTLIAAPSRIGPLHEIHTP